MMIMVETVKINLNKTDSKLVKPNETYDVIDNTNLNNLIVPKTILHTGKENRGYNQSGQNIYINKFIVKCWGGVAIIKDRMDAPYWFLRHKTGASPS